MAIHQTTNDAYAEIINRLQSARRRSTRGGDTREIMGVTVKSKNPRDRLFFRDGYNLAFQLQEAVAYWTGQNPGHVHRYNSNMEKFMHETEDGLKLEGSAYGRYLREIPHDQIRRVIKQLRDNSQTRQAVINFHQSGVERYDGPDVACTVYLQFMIRDKKLHLITSMRSQDMLWGYPYDVFNFQWIQEVMAGILDVGLGTYTHRMNSCHYYEEFEDDIMKSTVQQQKYCMPDIRLNETELERVMFYLRSGLKWARQGSIPNGEIYCIEQYSEFYADWLRFMTEYEQRRFHDDEADLKDEIEFEPFRRAL